MELLKAEERIVHIPHRLDKDFSRGLATLNRNYELELLLRIRYLLVLNDIHPSYRLILLWIKLQHGEINPKLILHPYYPTLPFPLNYPQIIYHQQSLSMRLCRKYPCTLSPQPQARHTIHTLPLV